MAAVEERQALYRELVLGAAEREFARVGFAESRMADVAHTAGLSLTTVYKTFPAGKDQIWDELHGHRMEALLAVVQRRTASATTPVARLLAGIAGVAEFLTGHDAYLELNLRSSSGWLTATSATGVQRTVWASGVEMVASGVEAARAAGELTDLRPGIATGLIISALQVWLADWVDADRDREPGEVVAELLSHVELVLTGTRPPDLSR